MTANTRELGLSHLLNVKIPRRSFLKGMSLAPTGLVAPERRLSGDDNTILALAGLKVENCRLEEITEQKPYGYEYKVDGQDTIYSGTLPGGECVDTFVQGISGMKTGEIPGFSMVIRKGITQYCWFNGDGGLGKEALNCVASNPDINKYFAINSVKPGYGISFGTSTAIDTAFKNGIDSGYVLPRARIMWANYSRQLDANNQIIESVAISQIRAGVDTVQVGRWSRPMDGKTKRWISWSVGWNG